MDYVRKVHSNIPAVCACIRFTGMVKHAAWFRSAACVLQESRGRWNSLDCLLAFGWCGSAVVGGFLLDRFGFDLTFIITASAQVCLAVQQAAPLLPACMLTGHASALTRHLRPWCQPVGLCSRHSCRAQVIMPDFGRPMRGRPLQSSCCCRWCGFCGAMPRGPRRAPSPPATGLRRRPLLLPSPSCGSPCSTARHSAPVRRRPWQQVGAPALGTLQAHPATICWIPALQTRGTIQDAAGALQR